MMWTPEHRRAPDRRSLRYPYDLTDGECALVRHNPSPPESHLLVGRMALEAGLTGRADRRAYVALSDLEEVEQGDSPAGRAAQARWLRTAATANPEPRWRCAACGTDHAGWAPVCPSCGAVETIGWTSPQTLPAMS